MAGAELSFPPFRSRPPWLGRDLQTLRNFLLRSRVPLDDYPTERLEFPMEDGSGDVLLGALHGGGLDRPLVVLIHGLGGSEDSSYMRASTRHFLGLGYPVLRLNLRGAGPSRGHCRFRYHAGRSEDLRHVVERMDERLAGRGLFLVGYSLGANLLLKYLGEAGPRAAVLGAASISAPIDLAGARRGLMRPRNVLYHRYLLACLKAETARLPLDPPTPRELATIRTIYAFDERILAPRVGFAGADDYYRRAMALPFLPEIAVPTLVIQSRDDPWIPFAPYAAFGWAAQPHLLPLFPRRGGHVGFHGRGGTVPWHDRCIALFLERCAAGRGQST